MVTFQIVMGSVLTICLALAAVLSYRQFPTPRLVIAGGACWWIRLYISWVVNL